MRNTFSKKTHTLRNSGFTLVELLVSMTLTAIFATAVVAIMPAATRIYMQIQDMSRAQIVADMVIDSLREECADTYIEDFASVRTVNTTAADDDGMIQPFISNVVNDDSITEADQIPASADEGNVLIIRKSNGYCEAIFACMPITYSNYYYVYTHDRARQYDTSYTLGGSSRAVYRFFNGGVGSAETNPGYVHYGYYSCAKKDVTWTSGSDSHTINCIFPMERYDYTNPFSIDSYNGYTVSLEFSKPSMSDNSDYYLQRPVDVTVTVNVYNCSYEEQAENSPIYSRTALLVFSEDTTK